MPLNPKDNDDKWDFEAHHPEDNNKILVAVPRTQDVVFSNPTSFEFKYVNTDDPTIQGKTFELVGHKIGNNPYNMPYNMYSEEHSIKHCYIQHGINPVNPGISHNHWEEPVTVHKKIKEYFTTNPSVEGIVLHIHNEEQTCFKIHRLHYQLKWK